MEEEFSSGEKMLIPTAIALALSPNIPLQNHKALQILYDDALQIIEPLVSEVSRLPAKQVAHAIICDRHQWIVSVFDSISGLITDMAESFEYLLDNKRTNSLSRKAINTMIFSEIGLLLGFVSQKVLGQYDTGFSKNPSDLLYIVESNIYQKEKQLGIDDAPFRLWILAHELTHKLQFENFVFLRGYYLNLIKESTDLLSKKIGQDSNFLTTTLNLLASKESRSLISRIQAFMSFIEGYADYVMFGVGKLLPKYERLEPIFVLRSSQNKTFMKKIIEKLVGFEMKTNQYRLGLKFIKEISDSKGIAYLNNHINAPDKLPTLEEINEPHLWLARLAES